MKLDRFRITLKKRFSDKKLDKTQHLPGLHRNPDHSKFGLDKLYCMFACLFDPLFKVYTVVW